MAVTRKVWRLEVGWTDSQLLGYLQAAQVPCQRAVGYDHRYCCTVHADEGAEHGDFPVNAERCRSWPRMANR